MKTVLGLDLSLTSAGLVKLRYHDDLSLISVEAANIGEPGKKSYSYEQRGRRLMKQAGKILRWCEDTDCCPAPSAHHQPILAVVEGLSLGSNLAMHHDVTGMWWGVVTGLFARGVPVAVIPPATLKMWGTGKGNADKFKMLDTAQDWYGREVILNDDQADAAILATAGAFRLGYQLPFLPRARHYDGLAKAAWPAGIPEAGWDGTAKTGVLK